MTEVRWLDDREEQAWRSLMAMQEGLAEFIDRQLRHRCGLSHADYQVLAHLSEAAEPLRAFELGRLLRWEKSRLSQHLTRMEKRGLVRRERCETDQRGWSIAITAEGTELIEAAAPQHVTDIREVVVDHLTKAELEALTAIGDKVRARLAAQDPER
ncbi:MarR family transcriptional regulator [Amycolatopsis sp., V23-08]|uniref:MarR family transcriptional regulator n=1 Tax=Amycolatopsis heterodermiae TaxID=3110235 RepID=A0ABU5R7U6_9PSEU|nr:MarR family transcriptional regulator [Amycolatopsis sp., V23-08]MEA5362296.1 MarR family transcriptional regulator [Amycolatopsis sp., V23-08]